MGQTRLRKLGSVLVVVFVLLVFALLPQPTHASSVVEKFPTSTSEIVAGWVDPTSVYALDDLSAICTSTPDAEQEYSGFNFTIPSTATIDRVAVKIRWNLALGLISTATEGWIELHFKVWDGSTWEEHGTGTIYGGTSALNPEPVILQELAPYPEVAMAGIDVTSFLNTSTKINGVKVRLLAVENITPNDWIMQVDAVSVEVVEVVYTTPTEENITAMAPFFIMGALIMLPIGLLLGKKT